MQNGLQYKEPFERSGLNDLEDVYNRVQIPTLAVKRKKKRIEYGILEIMVKWILSMVDTRSCKLQFGNWESERFEIKSGLPQATPPICVFFNIYIADVIDWIVTITQILTHLSTTSSLAAQVTLL